MDTQKFLEEIIDYAEQNKPISFSYIRSRSEYSVIKSSRKATKLIIKALDSSKKQLFKKYCKDIVDGSSDINKLLACSKLKDIIEFYSKELTVLEDMLEEYDAYLSSCNLVMLLDYLLFNDRRPYSELWDRRERKK